MTALPPEGRPVVIAHRGGNDLAALDRAKATGVDLAELDVWLHGGALEVRHLKTMGPIPLLWDRWRLVPGWIPRLRIEQVLESASRDIRLMIDLKSKTLALSKALIAVLARQLPGAPYTVTARNWPLLAPFEEVAEASIIPSAATGSELAELLPSLGERYQTLSLHRGLVTAELMSELTGRGVATYVWPINNQAWLEQVLAAGVSGVNTDDLELAAAVVARRPGAAGVAPAQR